VVKQASVLIEGTSSVTVLPIKITVTSISETVHARLKENPEE
jgi:hypothetical protein